MRENPAVLVGLGPGNDRDALVGWIRTLGYETAVAEDGRATVAFVRSRPLVASFLDSRMGLDHPTERVGSPDPEGDGSRTVWRVVRPIVGRRLVLMAWERRNELWFEALRSGVGALLRMPADRAAVRAALEAVTRPGACTRGRLGTETVPTHADQAAERQGPRRETRGP